MPRDFRGSPKHSGCQGFPRGAFQTPCRSNPISFSSISEALREIVKLHESEQIPFHIHIAEQQQEVDEFKCTHGERPVEWLLNNYDVNENWCLVHATHINENELK